MLWVYLSPHFDDVALSCGGLAWQQSQSGARVHIWTICAADPPQGGLSPFAEELHSRWETGREAVASRRSEDLASCTILGAQFHHFAVPDCVYRTDVHGVHLYASEESLFGTVNAAEDSLIEQVAAEIDPLLPHQANLVSPMTVGQHVDHCLVRAMAEKLAARRADVNLWYYADFPYALSHPEQLSRLRHPEWESVVFPLSSAAVHAWAGGFIAHASQISTFWPDTDTAQSAFDGYTQLVGGSRLWRPA